MTREPNEIEQALSKTVRSSLDRFQRTAEELQHAVNDLVAACSSARVANTLPAMMRAQMSAASLATSLEALSRFVTLNLPPALAPTLGLEPPAGLASAEVSAEPSAVAPLPAPLVAAPIAPPIARSFERLAEPPGEAPIDSGVETAVETANLRAGEAPVEEPAEAPPQPWASQAAAAPEPNGKLPEFGTETLPEPAPETVDSVPASELLMEQDTAPLQMEGDLGGSVDFTEFETAAGANLLTGEGFPEDPGNFDISILPADMQELHRRANRVAKVSMQDIKLLRPEDVRLGRENHDLCFRLRDDLERAHKEYDRRFQTILGHPVDYFYDWLVEILAEGDPQLLGEYPYPSAALRR